MRLVFTSVLAFGSLVSLPVWLQADGCNNETPVDCPRAAGPEDYVRRVVISKPYDAAGNKSNLYEVLELSTSGALTRTGVTFQMGRSSFGEIAFTPDGAIGIVPQENGTLGAFMLDAAGQVTVLETAFSGQFYASQVVIDPSGARAWVVDSNWRENGGGIYSVRIECDGTLANEGRVADAQLPYAMQFLRDGSGRALLGSDDVLSSAPADDAQLLQVEPNRISVIDGADAYGDEDAMISSLAVTFDGQFGLLGDNNLFSNTGNRVAVVGIEGMAEVQVLKNVEDPVAILASPFNDAALVVSGFGDALFKLNYAPAASTPFTLAGELSYSGGRPQLPGASSLISRGSLKGLVLIAENTGVRRVRFEGAGVVRDLGKLSLGTDYTAIPGALGVQP
ncbi:MAG: hypothetical protein ACKO6N_05520 [Myxococcota bacterium]